MSGADAAGLGTLGPWGACGVVAGAYLLGSISWSYLIVRLTQGRDLRTMGSGNAGATNAMRTAGKAAGVAAVAEAGGADAGVERAAAVFHRTISLLSMSTRLTTSRQPHSFWMRRGRLWRNWPRPTLLSSISLA